MINIVNFPRGSRDDLAKSEESLLRLACAAGCPDDEPMIPWLEERGLVEKTKDGWCWREAKPE
jgi:hypothetical protein